MVTVPPERAYELAKTLVSEQLAASVNLVPSLQSIYRWQGEVVEDPETLLFIKTDEEHYPALEARIVSLHTYEVPEILAFTPDRALPLFNEWLRDALLS